MPFHHSQCNPEDLKNLTVFPARCEISQEEIDSLTLEEYAEFLANCVEFDL